MQPLKIFIGLDPVESVAYHTLCHSIITRASVPVSITPIYTQNLRGVYSRPRDPKQSNEFSFTRFLVPYLAGYDGWALFMDCDMMLRTDIKELFLEADEQYAAMVVKHDYTPKGRVKYLGNIQYSYPRKNWSSVVLWNCAHPANRIMTPEYVNTATPADLHRFTHLGDEQIGELDVGWNFLVDEYSLNALPGGRERVKNIHWTNFGPWLDDYSHVDFADEWYEERALMSAAVQHSDMKKEA